MLAAGGIHTCGRLEDGRLRCWGGNTAGQLGSQVSNASTPVAVDVATDWAPVLATGTSHTCAAKTDGSLWCWGANTRGQTGSSHLGTYGPVPDQVRDGATSWAQITAGDEHTCGIGGDQNLWCFGVAEGYTTTVRAPAQVPGTWQSASAGASSTCAIDAAGALACWGNNVNGQVGDSTYTSRAGPTTIAGPAWQAVSVGTSSACAIRDTGALACWGTSYGGLGDGSMTRAAPTRISPRAWTSVSLALYHSCAIEAVTARLWCWGYNYWGQLGTGDVVSQSMPVQVTSQAWTSISANVLRTCGVGTAGLQCWGYNMDGTTSLNPAPIGLATSVGVGESHACALNGATVTCWGPNYAGQLGDGTIVDHASPAAVAGTWDELAVGSRHACAIARDHTLWCWGDNSQGAVGDGSTAAVLNARPRSGPSPRGNT